MRKAAAAFALLLSGLLMAGCFDIEQTLTLARNMSGTAGFSMKVNMEPMADFMLQLTRSMSGKTGPPTAAEREKARKDMLSSSKKETGSFEKDKAEMESKLPKGVTLLQSSFKENGLKMAVSFLFGFDQASKLNEISFPKKNEHASPAEPGNPVDSPFGGLQVVDEGATLLVTSPAQNPLADSKKEMAQAPPDPETQKQIEEMFAGLRVAFKITAPFAIVEHNAHRKEGNTLIWEFDLKTLEKLTPEQLKEGIRVRYRK